MPPSKRTKRTKRRAAGRRRRVGGARDVPDMASLSVKRSLSNGVNQFSANVLYNLMNVQLMDYPRAVQVAQAYQHYRIKKVTLTFKPSSDTFAVGGATKPRLYYMVDKSGGVPTTITLEGLKEMGAKPKDLDEKDLVVSWRPSVLEAVQYAGGGVGATSPSKYTISPWLTTNAYTTDPAPWVASAIDHLGLYWYVDMLNAAGYQYSIECEVQIQFKKPLSQNITSSVAAIPATLALLNQSPDGVVGGGDGI